MSGNNELTVNAKLDALPQVLSFIDERLENASCSPKAQMQIDIAAEEIFVNIAHYAYEHDDGSAVISVNIEGEPAEAVIEFKDHGKAFDPLAKADPDTTLSAEERQIGGLGIYMVKKSMDDVSYVYEGGQNILTIRKKM